MRFTDAVPFGTYTPSARDITL